MKREHFPYYAASALVLLNTLTHPFDLQNLWLLLGAVLFAAVSGLIAAVALRRRPRAVYADLFCFGDFMMLALPVLLIIVPFCPMASTAAVIGWLLFRIVGGWLLRCAGLRNEKNFTLILAYRQTIAHCHRFSGEIHPSRNPLFRAARSAQDALWEMLPAAVLLAAWLLRAAGVALPETIFARYGMAALAITLILVQAPPHIPLTVSRQQSVPAIFAACARLAVLLLITLLFRNKADLNFAFWLFLSAPASGVALSDLKNCSADDQIIAEAECLVHWSQLLWPFLLAIALILN